MPSSPEKERLDLRTSNIDPESIARLFRSDGDI